MKQKTILNSGLVVISEYIPNASTFALSYSLKSGSRAETTRNNGIHHLLEHMMFKGSRRYDLKKIADISDRLGGRLNAFTGKEITQYYIRSIAEKLPESLDLLTEMTFNSIFPPQEFEKEKNVIIQEIKESLDNPDTTAFDSFYQRLFQKNPLAFPITGTEKHMQKMAHSEAFREYQLLYQPYNFILSGVGQIQHAQLVELVQPFFQSYSSAKPSDFFYTNPDFYFQSGAKKNPSLQQLYVIIGFRGISINAPDRYAFLIMNEILGSGMSSRLFQRIREEKGLAYTISSFHEGYCDCGIHLIYSVIEPQNLKEFLNAVKGEVLALKEKGITPEELQRAKDHFKSNFILGLENHNSRMRFNVNQELYIKKDISIDTIIAELNQINLTTINQMFQKYLDLSESTIFVYGKPTGSRLLALNSQHL